MHENVRLVSAWNWLEISNLIFANFCVSGYMFDSFGNYTASFIMAGITPIFGALFMSLDHILMQPQKNNSKHDIEEQKQPEEMELTKEEFDCWGFYCHKSTQKVDAIQGGCLWGKRNNFAKASPKTKPKPDNVSYSTPISFIKCN